MKLMCPILQFLKCPLESGCRGIRNDIQTHSKDWCFAAWFQVWCGHDKFTSQPKVRMSQHFHFGNQQRKASQIYHRNKIWCDNIHLLYNLWWTWKNLVLAAASWCLHFNSYDPGYEHCMHRFEYHKRFRHVEGPWKYSIPQLNHTIPLYCGQEHVPSCIWEVKQYI